MLDNSLRQSERGLRQCVTQIWYPTVPSAPFSRSPKGKKLGSKPFTCIGSGESLGKSVDDLQVRTRYLPLPGPPLRLYRRLVLSARGCALLVLLDKTDSIRSLSASEPVERRAPVAANTPKSMTAACMRVRPGCRAGRS